MRLARLRRAEAAEGRARKAALCAGVPVARAAAAGRRPWVVTAGQVPASVPVWPSQGGWLADQVAWADSTEGRAACRAVHMSRRAIVRIAEAVAPLADYSTGRNVAMAFDKIGEQAGYCAEYISRALHLWEAAGLAVEGFRGGRFGGHNRTSVWHLVSRSQPAAPTADAEILGPPPSRRDRRSVTVSNHVPSAASAARPRIPPIDNDADRQRRRKRRPPGAADVSPEARRIGAWLAGHSQGMYHAPWRTDRDHSGALAIALDRSGLDLSAWSGPSIAAAFDADMRRRGWYWPHRIEHPGAFLAARLRRLPVRPDGPTRDGGCAAAGLDRAGGSTRPTSAPARYVAEPPRPPLTEVQRARISEAQEGFRTHMAHRQTGEPPVGSVAVTVATLATPAGDTCAVCGGGGGVRRPWLPARRAMICPDCWTTTAVPDDAAAVEASALSVGSASDRRHSALGGAG